MGKLVRLIWRLLLWSFIALLAYPLLETLIWRRLWKGRAYSTEPPQKSWSTAVLYLSGLSHFAKFALLPNQVDLLQKIAERFGTDVVVAQQFPFEDQTARRFAPLDLWRRLGSTETPVLIFSLRNFWQAGLATWFHVWYGASVARAIHNRLGRPNGPAKLVILGNSAGGALCLAAAPFLRQWWGPVELTFVMCGGIFGSTPGFDEVTAFHQLLGARDEYANLPNILAPGRRWQTGAFGRALRDGRYQEHVIGNHKHFGAEGYFGDAFYPETAAAILRILDDGNRLSR